MKIQIRLHKMRLWLHQQNITGIYLVTSHTAARPWLPAYIPTNAVVHHCVPLPSGTTAYLWVPACSFADARVVFSGCTATPMLMWQTLLVVPQDNVRLPIHPTHSRSLLYSFILHEISSLCTISTTWCVNCKTRPSHAWVNPGYFYESDKMPYSIIMACTADKIW